MEENNLFPKDLSNSIDYLFLNFGDKYIDCYMSLASQLRSKDKVVEIYSKKSNIKKQMIYANKKKVKFVIIFGETESAAKNIIIKNMEDGSQEKVAIDKLLDFI